MTVADIVKKRKKIWAEKMDAEYDRQFVKAAAVKILTTKELANEIRQKPYLLIEAAFNIIDKNKRNVPFFLNEVQADFISKFEQLGTNKPYYILKGRQQGFTSLITAMQLSYAVVQKNFSGFTLADSGDNTRAIFNDKARMVYARLPDELKPTERFNSVNELFFDKLNSSWRIATATDQVGRSRTLNFVHFSEVAFYECSLANLQKGIGEAMTDGAFRVYETTANGFNEAKDLWDSETCYNLFYEWWRTNEYRSKEYQYLDTSDSWLLERIKVLKAKGLDKEQITWYCKKYASYLDKNTIKQEYPITPIEAFVSSGDCVFDKEAINNQIANVTNLKPARKGYFKYKKEALPILNSNGETEDIEWKIKNIEFIDDDGGYITIHEAPRVKTSAEGEITAKAPYVIGGDTAGSGEDYFTAKVIDNITGKTAATLHKQRMDEDIYAEQLFCLGCYYNDALIGIETNYSRHPIRVLRKYGYPKLYLRERVDKLARTVEHVYGFETTSKTKPVIIGELVELMRSNPTIEVDIPTLKEMTTFVKKDNGKQEAIDGAHDDLVMALAIAHFISNQQSRNWLSVISEEPDFMEMNFTSKNDNGDFMSWEDF